MYRNWVPLLYSSKLLSRVVHLSFTGLRTIPLQSILAQCPQLRDLRLVNSRWVQEDAKEEDWSGVPLESLSFSPASRDNPLNFGAALGVLLHSGGNKSFLHNLRYDLCLSGLDDAGCLFQLVTLLNAAPPVCSSLRHLSLGSNIWTYILLDERYEPDTLHLLPFSHLPHLESLSITTPTNSALQPVDNFFATGLIISSDSQSNDDDLNCFCGWFCRHLTLESSLPPSFTEVIFVIEVDVDLVSQNIEAAPLSPDLESVLISSQFHFNFIVKTRNVFRDSMNREYWKCSRTLKMWGKGIFNAGKMTVLQR
ncbi:hypothetical protein DL96DRAFT_1613863 [Flagelloscypha sp. PMI_526]|nr:hypothetical protein DL96DRAFT_1613863 [Flagelloscypha sp. PMI_526]